MPTASRPGVDIYYERRGQGPRLLFLNGSGGTLESTRPLLDLLAGSCELVAHDQRGLGRTTIPDGVPTMADYAADAAAVLDAVGWATAAVLGVSFGGMVAQELAVTWPERIERLALACTSPGGEGGSSYPLHELVAMEPGARAEIGLRILDSRFTAEWLEEHPSDRALVEFRVAAAAGERSADQLRGEALQMEARRGHDVYDRLHHITCPTLVAYGRFDGIAPASNSEAIGSRIPQAELRAYEGGHIFFMQDRAALPDITAFLSSRTVAG